MSRSNGSNNDPDENKKMYRNLFYYGLLMISCLIIFNMFFNPFKPDKISYSAFEKLGRQGKIREVQIGSDTLYITAKDKDSNGKIYYTERLMDIDLLDNLKAWGVNEYGGVDERKGPLGEILLSWIVPLFIFIGLGKIIGMTLSKGMKNMNPMSMSKSNAKEYNMEKNTGVTFQDVAGQGEAKKSLEEVVDYLHNPKRYKDIGAKLPKGLLLVGPPGTGKTLLAKAVAGEAHVPFFSISGSEFVQMFVGMGAARVRDLFNKAKKKAPCIIFIDEVDAIGKARDTAGIGGNDEREQTLNQLLTEMDGFDSSEQPIVILAATNRPEILDKALLRPGRFDRRVIVNKPDFIGRKKILEVHVKKVKLEDNVNLENIAKMTAGSSGADLANMVNEAALRAVRHGKDKVSQRDLEESIEAVFAGEAKRDRIMSRSEKISVAYHEAGHALAGALQERTDPVTKITIVPTTMGALGYTLSLPTEEKYLVSKEELEEKIVVMLAGRAAEEVKLNQISTGASNDIEKATEMARRMITIYGMSDKFDMMGLESSSGRYMDGSPVKNYSAQTGKEIDEEVLGIIKKAHERAKKILIDNMKLLDKVSNLLLEKESLSGEEFYELVKKYRI
ncbi:MAG: ATP-dependent zinc metalloprotease FtsH [Anaeromicrobium sp.]|uniref:ATP-dependent zinc metalloprotease FtsH n=1 Tax=Anaeromicrobium sp. TaxID=1929132 RepID=UPI0025F57C7C|nr:ATP-dependent zinc metalloprotease FtsH [Anaeromicrobium sp.]MCT4592854.1 ATP-dependent zinc metalloprotease FtsH [Anaeromicrobium sp.]